MKFHFFQKLAFCEILLTTLGLKVFKDYQDFDYVGELKIIDWQYIFF